ncbi:alpha/beta hydrolase [Frankia sp. EUN1f]|uniref:alpha/beta hydrolase n=1 Tax=Parafrankia sp. EUN1f TaxID=102897 RepID=UPI0001C4421D|nr:Alpha/beta hydrolase fold-3 domain protein [Parafrankia sp. EUN1f]
MTPSRPPFDPELEPVVLAYSRLFPRLGPDTLTQLRALTSEGVPGQEPMDYTVGGSVVVEDLAIVRPDGTELVVTVLRPRDAPPDLLGILHVHGGGMVMGTRMFGVDTYLPYVVEGHAVIVTVEYRLAPEHPDPAPVEDCYAALTWMGKAAGDLGVDGSRLMVVGASAGGGLAAGAVLMARDRGFPAVSHQILDCPMLDDRLQTHSSRMLDNDGPWDQHDNIFGWNALLGERRGGRDVSYYAAPARAEELSGLPRTYLSCGSVDSFRDEVLDFALKLSQAGVLVDLHIWGGAFHGFDLAAQNTAVAQASMRTRDEFVRRIIRE